nr:hypothetical protein [Tanacetum cinerariifolium]
MTNYRYWLPITSSSWSFISAILGQMTYLVADSTPNCAKSEELFEPRFELDDQEWVEMGSFLFDLLGSSMRKGLLLLRVIEEEGKKTKSRRTKESESSKKPSTTKQTSKGKAPIKASKIGKSTSAKEQVKEPIVEVVMDDAGDNVARDVNQAQDTSEPKTRKTLNPDLFKQPPRPPTLDPEWNKCHRTVTADYFFNNDMEYLKSSDPEVTYTTSITKTKAARYEIKGIEDMVPTLWSAIKHAYDKDAKKEIKHWGERCKLWYRSQRSKLSKQNVYSNKVILGVKSVSVKKLHKYGHLEEIVVKRSDQQLYKFKEGDFVDLHLNDI